MILEIVEYLANGLLDVFSMDLDYFTQAIPITDSIVNIVIASGWALLLGNLVFQASKGMMSGIGLEGEDPKTLFTRTFLFAFLLLASRQICEIGLGMTGTVIEMLQMPDAVSISLPDENIFGIAASWLLMIVVGVVLMFQIVKLFLTVGERYFLVGFLTIMAPWAFAMGGSKSTADIFKGWVRMFASMCLMMILNVVFLKMLLSALGNMPEDAGVIAWIIFVVAICRVARKIDNIIMRIGLNPAAAGEGLGRGFLGNMASFVVMRTVSAQAIKAISGITGGAAKTATGGTPPPKAGANASAFSRNNSNNQHSSHGGTTQNTVGVQTGMAGTAEGRGPAAAPKEGGTGARPPISTSSNGPYHGTHGKTGTVQLNQSSSAIQNVSRRSSLPETPHGTRGTAGMDFKKPSEAVQSQIGQRGGTPLSMPGVNGAAKPIGTAGNKAGGSRNNQSRFSSVPQAARNSTGGPGTSGTAHSTRLHQGGVSSQIQDGGSNVVNEGAQSTMAIPKTMLGASPANKQAVGTHGNMPHENRRSSADLPSKSASPSPAAKSGTSGSGIQPRQDRNAPSISPNVHGTSGHPRHDRNGGALANGAKTTEAKQSPSARQEGGNGKPEAPRKTNQPPTGTAGKRTEFSAKPPIIKPGDIARNSIVNQGTRRLGGIENIAGESRKSSRNADKKDEGVKT